MVLRLAAVIPLLFESTTASAPQDDHSSARDLVFLAPHPCFYRGGSCHLPRDPYPVEQDRRRFIEAHQVRLESIC